MSWTVTSVCFAFASVCGAQSTPQPQPPGQPKPAGQTAPPPAPEPLPLPVFVGPLKAAPPNTFDAGPFGKLHWNGILSGLGLWQGSPIADDDPLHADVSNGQVFIQKNTGWWQFYLQAGAYYIPALGTKSLSTSDSLSELFGPLPVGFLKLVPSKHVSLSIGALPPIYGAEYAFTFQNMNIERGLLWNQENDINRGIQLDATAGPITASFSWNDGFYSNRYSWLTGSFTYAFNKENTLTFAGGGNLGQTAFRTLATPVQNNSRIFNIIYTYKKDRWIVQPYFQYTRVPENRNIGIDEGASTKGGAILASYSFTKYASLAGRGEYISSTGDPVEQSVNLIYGPGSDAWSITLTPTFQFQRFFVRGDLSFVRAINIRSGDALGRAGTSPNQARGVIEAGLIF